jgi:hypothetical protein
VDGAVQELAIGTGAAARELAHLRRLFAEPLGRLEPDLGFERFSLEANRTEPLEGVPDGPPAQLRYGGRSHCVLWAVGPERLEPEWWGADAGRPARDYYRVQTVEGPRLWICRLLEPGINGTPRWFLHGELA